MQVLRDNFDLDQFFSDLSGAIKPILLLDYDGTLAPFQVKRDEAVPYPGVREILNQILRADHTHILVISGRRVDDLTALLKLEKQPEIWGSHGNERLLRDGRYILSKLSERESRGLDLARKWAKEQGLDANLEEKPASLAFHWRGLDKSRADEIRKNVRDTWEPVKDYYNLKLLDFDGGIEIKVAGRNKGDAVQRILTEIDEIEEVAYLGDDFTDEDAFRALQGKGLRVLVRQERRETLADLWIIPPDELLYFLRRWHEARSR
ncbi:MAG TPA: trehalose-phosphatase [candidate division Zixibacteria bacterium]|nr:trehalose-phosphatase [candidate division Zixibacteria bacterium]HEQ99338.1 trehalose-phosphatase [candidate division Zixibacteria bacterium]